MLALYSRYGIALDENDSGPANAATRPGSPVGSGSAPHVDDARLGTTPPINAQGSRSVVVWKLRADSSIEPVQIVVGITDHAYTAVIDTVRGELEEGDQLITGALVAKGQPPRGSSAGASPKK